jgi:hypothetical protein
MCVPDRESTSRLGVTVTYVAPASGIAAGEASEGSLVPATFVAVTLNVYQSRFVSPETVQERAPVEWHVREPGVETTSYAVTGLPPSNGGAFHETSAAPLDARAAAATGGSGRVRGVTAGDGSDGKPVPRELVAVTVKV